MLWSVGNDFLLCCQCIPFLDLDFVSVMGFQATDGRDLYFAKVGCLLEGTLGFFVIIPVQSPEPCMQVRIVISNLLVVALEYCHIGRVEADKCSV